MSSSLGNTQLLVGRATGYSSTNTADISGNMLVTNGLNVSGTSILASTAGSQSNSILTVGSGSSNNFGALKFIGNRTAIGADWVTSSLRIQKYVDSTNMGYMEFGALGGNQDIAFGNNGNERMRITSSGNVGIGTTTPSHQLSVGGLTGMAIYSNIGGSTQTFNAGAGTYIGWNMLNGGAETDIVNFNSGSFQGGFAFYNTTGSTFSSSSPLLMRITAAGNVGIGETNPVFPLDIYNGTANSTNLQLKSYVNTTGTSQSHLQLVTGNYGGKIGGGLTQTVGPIMTFHTINNGTSTEVMRMLSKNVGIGTTTPPVSYTHLTLPTIYSV